jgi:hypothetical protein
MFVRRCVPIAVLFALFCPGRAGAQEGGQVGVVMGYPASAGVVWHASDRIAIRPEVNFSYSSGDSSTTTGNLATASSASTVGVGVSGLFYLAGKADLWMYISPKFTYGRNNSSTESAPGSSRSENTSNTYSVAGSFGAQYALGKRFSVFGEVGLVYSWQTSSYSSTTANVIGTDSTANSVGTRTAVGVIVYFQ